ncbi:MAG TPA: ATP-binding protein [Thermoanaerobaculia bacterium]|nr:ATP-binding protein [Thermoanaerobaculia bacterium]
MWIDRQLSDQVLSAARQFPALVVTGGRQTGKTTLLRHLFPQASFASLDLPSAAYQADQSGEEFLRTYQEPVILDEVQYAPGLFRHLKLAIDARRSERGRFLMTGSQKFSLMHALSESLAGRCAVLELDTLASTEIVAAFPEEPILPAEILWRGGFPELWRDREIESRLFYSSYVATYLERDVRLTLRIGSLRDFERFLRACALRSGQLLNLTELARDVGIAGSTARDWLSVLEASSQVVLLEPYFNNPTRRLIKTPKLYFRDTGLLCFLLGLENPAALAASSLAGAVWETFVLGQILRARTAAGSVAQVFFWRDVHGTEVDFLIEQNASVRLIEAKWTEALGDSRALKPLLTVRDLFGDRAASEHWVACRTRHPHALAGVPGVRLVNAVSFDGWFGGTEGRGPS